jgi:uncharacterized membrane protein (DUF2068 family)
VAASSDARAPKPRNLRGFFGVELRLVAVFEFAKGMLVLFAGLGLLTVVHRDIQDVAEELLLHLHLNPSSRIPGIFLALVERVSNVDMWFLALGALTYASVRIAEGLGLWFDRAWAEWLGVASGLIYVPFEVYALTLGVTPLKVVTFMLNLIVVAVLADALWRRRQNGNRPRFP